LCIYTILTYILFKDDFGDSDIDESKVLGDIAEKEESNVGNGIIHEEKEVKQVVYLLYYESTILEYLSLNLVL